MFWKKSNSFYNQEEAAILQNAVQKNELHTSGEIRICVESRCYYIDPLDRARELFYQLKMYETKERNAILIYIAYKDKDFAIFGDAAIYNKEDAVKWKQESTLLAKHFHRSNFLEGLLTTINNIGSILTLHFPNKGQQKNELPDEIVFGK
ncbi:MAG: TPM domain-containing protein [Chitinophagaceae bacterium]